MLFSWAENPSAGWSYYFVLVTPNDIQLYLSDNDCTAN